MNTDPVNPNPSASARRVFVSAGEASGDAHAARLLRALPPEIRGTTDFYGIGGDALRAAGCDTSIADARKPKLRPPFTAEGGNAKSCKTNAINRKITAVIAHFPTLF